VKGKEKYYLTADTAEKEDEEKRRINRRFPQIRNR
jgi:hypothetical protein